MNPLKMQALLFAFGAFAFSAESFAVPNGLTFQGRLMNNGAPVESSPVKLTLKITSPTDQHECVLFEEDHSLNMTNSDGIFTVRIGGGSPTSNNEGLTLEQVFSNDGVEIENLACASGTTYRPLSGQTRNIYVSFEDQGSVVAFASPYVIQSVPYAIEAQRLAGKPASGYLQTTTNTTQTKLNDLMATATFDEIVKLVNGTSTRYMTSSASAGIHIPDLTTEPASPTAGQIWYKDGLLRYYDANSSSVKSIGSFAGTTSPTTAAGYGITDTVLKGGQPGALTLGTSNSNNLTMNTDGTARMTILSTGNVGVGTSTPSSPFQVSATSNVTTGTVHAQHVQFSANPGATSDAKYRSIHADVDYASSFNSTGNIVGFSNNVTHSGSGNLKEMAGYNLYAASYSTGITNSALGINAGVFLSGPGQMNSGSGAYISVYRDGSGTLSNGTGASLNVTNAAAGTIGTAIAGDFSVLAQNTGTIDNAYGVYVGSVQGTNKWSIYASDASAPSHFAGIVGIGTTNPQSELHVNGYVQLGLTSGPPTNGDCNGATRGRMKVDTAAGRLYICVDSGWIFK